jgi:hypothetical protein
MCSPHSKYDFKTPEISNYFRRNNKVPPKARPLEKVFLAGSSRQL